MVLLLLLLCVGVLKLKEALVIEKGEEGYGNARFCVSSHGALKPKS